MVLPIWYLLTCRITMALTLVQPLVEPMPRTTLASIDQCMPVRIMQSIHRSLLLQVLPMVYDTIAPTCNLLLVQTCPLASSPRIWFLPISRLFLPHLVGPTQWLTLGRFATLRQAYSMPTTHVRTPKPM